MTGGHAGPGSPPTAGGVTLDVVSRLAITPNGVIRLTRTQTDLLAYLMRRSGGVCSRAELMANVWGYSEVLESRTVDVHVAALRDKLRKAAMADAVRIRTVRGVGYRLDAT